MSMLVKIRLLISILLFFFVAGFADERDSLVDLADFRYYAFMVDAKFYDMARMGVCAEKNLEPSDTDCWGRQNVDVVTGIYFHSVDYFDTTICNYKSGLFVGKKDNGLNEEIWLLTDRLNMDSINYELKIGTTLSMDYFTKIDFDKESEYILYGESPLEQNTKYMRMAYVDSLSWSFNELFFFLYRNDSNLTAFCSVGGVRIGCLFNNSGSLSFGYIPKPSVGSSGGIPENPRIVECYSKKKTEGLIGVGHQVRIEKDNVFFKINGCSSKKDASNVYVQNKKKALKIRGRYDEKSR